MGNSTSCYNCFIPEGKAGNKEIIETPYIYENTFTGMVDAKNRNSETPEEEVESEALSKTDLLDTITASMQKFLADIKEDPEKLGYKQVLTQNSVEVLLKDVPGGYSLMSIWKCTFPPEKVAKFLKMVDRRKDWDTHVSECKKICDITNDIAVYYTLYKRFLTMAPRDVLIVGQQIRVDDGWVDVSTSIDSSLVPETTSIVRAKVILAGYYMKAIPKDDHGNLTEVISISEANFGQSLAVGIVKSMSTNLTPKFVKAMIDGMKKLESIL
jgi:START domain